jgi:hypothetical protein
MSDIVKQCGEYQVVIGPGRAGMRRALEPVGQLRDRFAVVPSALRDKECGDVYTARIHRQPPAVR